MRHRKNTIKLGRVKAPREALIRNLLESFILHGRIRTTKAKARALRRAIEPMITSARRGRLSDRRMLYQKLSTKLAANKLFEEIAPRFQNRPGGYTRITKIGQRASDGADVAVIEFVA